MDYEKLLNDIEKMFDKKFDEILKPINDRLAAIELKQDITNRNLDYLRLEVGQLKVDAKQLSVDIQKSENNIRKEIRKLKDDDETMFELLKMNNLVI